MKKVSREWAIKKSAKNSTKFVYIGDEEQLYLSAKRRDEDFDIRDYACPYCGVDYTAKCFDSDRSSHFAPGTKETWKPICERYNKACEVSISNETREQLSAEDQVHSDPDFPAKTTEIIEELIFPSSNNQTNAPSSSYTGSVPGRPASNTETKKRSNLLASVVHCVLSNSQTIAYHPLKIPGCSESTYGGIFQNLSNLQGADEPRGEHIFFGAIDFREPPIRNEESLVFRYFMTKRNTRTFTKGFKVSVYLDKWKKAHQHNFIKLVQEAYYYQKRRYKMGKTCYIYLFLLSEGTGKYKNSLVVNEYNKVYIVSSELKLNFDFGAGIYNPEEALDAQEIDINPTEEAITNSENSLNSTQTIVESHQRLADNEEENTLPPVSELEWEDFDETEANNESAIDPSGFDVQEVVRKPNMFVRFLKKIRVF